MKKLETIKKIKEEVTELRKQMMEEWAEQLEPREAAKLSADINRCTRIMRSLGDILKRENSGNEKIRKEEEIPKK